MANCSAYDHGACATNVEYITYLYIYTFIAFSGITMNTLSLVVFCRRPGRMNKSSLTYLTCLAAYDLCFLTTACYIGIARCIPARQEWQVYAKSYYEIYCYLAVSNTFASASVFLTAVITVDRYLYIRYPAGKRYVCGERAPVIYTVICLFMGLGMNIPYYLYKEVGEDGAIVYTELGESENFYIYSWARLVLNMLIPVILVIIFNALLIRTVVTSQRQVRATQNTTDGRQRHQQTRMTLMMISISGVFVICHSLEPIAQSELYKSIFGPCSTYTTAYRAIRVVANTLEILSFATNFISYCSFNSEFRKCLRQALCCCTLVKVEPSAKLNITEVK